MGEINKYRLSLVDEHHHNIHQTHTGTPTLLTHKMVMDRISVADLPYCDEWGTSKEAYLHLPKRPFTHEQMPGFLAFMEKLYQDPHTYFWAMRRRKENASLPDDLIAMRQADEMPSNRRLNYLAPSGIAEDAYDKNVMGVLYVDGIGTYNTWCKIDFILGRKYWLAPRYLPEAVGAALDYLFGVVGFHRVIVTIPIDNIPGAKMLEQMGFQHEGVMREQYPNLYIEDSWYDASMFSILDYEWRMDKMANTYLDNDI